MNQSEQKSTHSLGSLFAIFIPIIISAGLTVGFAAIGHFTGLTTNQPITNIVYFAAVGLLAVSILVGYVAGRNYIRKMNQIPVAQRIDMMKAQQSATRDSLKWASKRIARLQASYILTYVWYICIMVALSLVAYTPSKDITLVYGIVPFAGWYMLMLHFRSAIYRYDFSNYVAKEDYPLIYGIAEKARNTIGVKGDIKIIFRNDSNAGIQKLGSVYSLQLGLHLLAVLTEEELYQVLLHEFAHMTDTHVKSSRGLRLRLQMLANAEQSIFPLAQMTLYGSARFMFECMMYHTLASEQIEAHADALMRVKGNPQVSMTALCKTAMQAYFEREFDKFIPEHFYAPEKPRENIVTLQCDAFRRAIQERGDFWLHLLEIELPPQVQSHPTFQQRREALGMADTPIILALPADDEPYRLECIKATTQYDKELHEAASKDYDQAREELYLKPLAIIEDYENASVPYTTAELSPVINAYRDLGRKEEAISICEHIIATETNKFATAHALYFRGRYRLAHYDASGIDDLYQAMDINMNYAEDGLDAIGDFCCMMGLYEERETYRQKYIELTQERMDKYDQAGSLTPDDHLVAEEFPDDRLEAMLLFMKRAGNGCIWQIHLVRKIITDDFFASAFVIRFQDDTSPEQVEKTMEAIFNFLDTTPEDWQYALFLYDRNIEKALSKVPSSCVWDCNKV